jgi:AraC-like DNA-binding protein
MASVSDQELRKLSALRAQLESFAAREAAIHVRDEAEMLAGLHTTLALLKDAVRQANYNAFRSADSRLHELIVRMAKIPLLLEVWRMVWDRLIAFHHQAFKEYFPDLRTLAEEHEYLVASIARGDPNAAEDAARSHVDAVWLRVAERRAQPAPESDPLQRAAAHMAFRFHAPLLLREVAAHVAFTSAGNLSRLFRIHYGLSFQGYLQKLRLEKAAELLKQTQMPVSNICQRVGYRDLSRFGQHFKRRFGKPPAAWRKTC